MIFCQCGCAEFIFTYIICNPVFEINKPTPFFLICLAKELQHIIFCAHAHAHAHACSPSYTDEE